jgi:hypothetical protein
MQPESKGIKKTLPSKPNPLQKAHTTNTKSMGHNPRVELCPKTTKKKKRRKIEDFGEMGFRVFVGKNGKWGAMVAGGG